MEIRLKKVNKNYAFRKLFSDFSLNIPLNQLVFIVGKSGSGKTSLLNLIGGLENNDDGLITLYNENSKTESNINHNDVDFVFQDSNLFDNLNVLNNIKVATKMEGNYWDKEKTLNLIKKLDFDESILKVKVSKLSGGEKQRVAILRSLTRDKNILLVDEPTGNLDEQNSKVIFETLKDVSKEKSVIVVTHDLDYAMHYGDTVINIDENNASFLKNTIKDDQKNIIEIRDKKESNFKNRLTSTIPLSIGETKKRFISTSILTLLISLLFVTVAILSIIISGISTRNNLLSPVQLNAVEVSSRGNRALTKDDITKFEKLLMNNIEHTTTINDDNSSFSVGLTPDNLNVDVKLDQIENSDFFKNRFENNPLLTGSFILNKNEIILNKKYVEELQISDPINKTIFLKSFSSLPVEVKIVGISDFVGSDLKPVGFISNSFINSLPLSPTSDKTNDKYSISILRNDFVNVDTNFHPSHFNNIGVVNNNESILIGRNVTNDNEYIISKTIADLYQINQLDENTSRVFKIETNGRKIENIAFVVGVFNSETSEIKTSAETLKILSDPPVVQKVFYLKNTSGASNIDTLEPFKMFRVTNINNIYHGNVFENTVETLVIVRISTIVAAFLCLLVLITTSFLRIKLTSKDIGIMKLFGAKLYQVMIFNFSNILFVNLLVLTLAFVVVPPIILELAKQYLVEGFYEINWGLSFGIIIGIWLSTIFLSVLIYFLVSLKWMFKKPLSLLK